MIENIPETLPAVAAYGGTALVGAALAIRWLRRMFYVDKKDTAHDNKDAAVSAAETSLFDNLRKENERMSDVMKEMSDQLSAMGIQVQKLVQENHILTMRVSELTLSVKSLSKLETENVELLRKIAVKDDRILKLTQDMADMFARFSPTNVSSTVNET